MSYSPPPATSASEIASCTSPWLRSARRIDPAPPTPFARCSTKRRRSSPAHACECALLSIRDRTSGLPSQARQSSAAPPWLRSPDRRRNRTFFLYPMSGGLNLDIAPFDLFLEILDLLVHALEARIDFEGLAIGIERALVVSDVLHDQA